ncbi:MAG TPA: tRNA-uridine aminocarboxypropyltransferase [Kofleriaceae bacterium]|nr:tRNA-uridine aminocarboxypropyltransferase [Kofleriaceae bacterium]
MGSDAALATPRLMCSRCRRPARVCYCRALPRLPTATRVVILQHPRERDVPIGTARMASLCLPAAELHVGVRWADSAPLARALGDPARPPILLYPGPGARDILREPPRGPVTLVVVDGTWSQARTVVRDNPVLQSLPRYAFDTPEPSHYRIRREPRAEYVSTIEALMHVLGVLEGDPPRFRSLLEPLRAMVDAQLACQAAAPRSGPRQPKRPRPVRPRAPEVIARRFDDLVCVVGEANAWPYRGDASRHPDELVHWVAHRLATGETFARIAAPVGPLSPSTAFHCGLSEDALRGGAPCADVVAAFARFTRPSDILCAWGHYGLDLVARSGGALRGERLDLRAHAARIANRKLGSLEAYAATLAPSGSPLAAPAPLADGRAGQRLALLVQIVRAWRASLP